MKTVRTRPGKTVAQEPVLAMNRRFGAYAPEEVHIVRKPEVKKDRAVGALKKLYYKTKKLPIARRRPDIETYDRISLILKNHEYSAKDIERFSIALVEFQDEPEFSWASGLLLSALINNGKDMDYVIHTRHLESSISYLGCQNTKNITIEGDAGMDVGDMMESGTITVEGDASSFAGQYMKGGAIIIKGSGGRRVGAGMEGGEIHVYGEIPSVGNFLSGTMKLHGKIFHKGELVVDK